MKKLAILFIVLSSITSYSQIELKGFKLGEPYSGERINMTSLGGLDGAIIVGQINDGRSYMFTFVPTEDGDKKTRVYESDITKLKNGLEKKFDLNFKRISQNSYSDDDYYLKAKKNGVEYIFSVESNQFMDPCCELIVWISNMELDKINQKEEQLRANDDF